MGFVLCFIACNKENPDNENEGYTLIWSDEFDTEINPLHWNFEIGDGTDYGLPPGWGNSERQLYTSSVNNAGIQPDAEGNSVLVITAREEPGELKFSSAKLTTQKLHSVRFGKVEARIKVPKGRGLWPAFWLLGDNIDMLDWPGCGEIDIMEVIGHETNVLHSSVHYTNNLNKLESNTVAHESGLDLSADYHIYGMDWTDTNIHFTLDGNIINTVPIEPDMKEFLRSFYLIFNLAVGGNWPGDPDTSTEFPKTLQVDWIRVYSNDGLNPAMAPELDIAEESLGTISTSLPPHAFNDDLSQFENILIKSFGDGGEPEVFTSDIAIDGDSSLVFMYPGSSWGGAFFELEPTIDASQYANGHLKFSMIAPPNLASLEIKLESVATAYSVFIEDYTPTELVNSFVEYAIPLADFIDLDLTDLKIPFAAWNPMDNNGDFVPFEIIIDNIYMEE